MLTPVTVPSPASVADWPARLGLMEAYSVTGDETAFQQQLAVLSEKQELKLDCKLLQAKWYLARKEFASAQQFLHQLLAEDPTALQAKGLLSHAYLQEGKDLQTARKTLEEILSIDPENREARHNLDVLTQMELTP